MSKKFLGAESFEALVTKINEEIVKVKDYVDQKISKINQHHQTVFFGTIHDINSDSDALVSKGDYNQMIITLSDADVTTFPKENGITVFAKLGRPLNSFTTEVNHETGDLRINIDDAKGKTIFSQSVDGFNPTCFNDWDVNSILEFVTVNIEGTVKFIYIGNH